MDTTNLIKLIVVIVAAAVLLFAQGGGGHFIQSNGVPSGACAIGYSAVDTNTGLVYPCPSGTWGSSLPVPSSGGLPAGAIVLVASGTCPAGFVEATALDGKMLRGTLSSHGDVGTTGGAATITPAGTVSQPTLSMNSYTPAGTNGATATTGNCASSVKVGTSGSNACPNTAPNLAVPAEAFTGTPATLTGTVSQPTFTGTPVDPSPSYLKVIFCSKS